VVAGDEVVTVAVESIEEAAVGEELTPRSEAIRGHFTPGHTHVGSPLQATFPVRASLIYLRTVARGP
jgi:hypothetical protein